MKKYKEEAMYLKLFNRAMQASMDDNLPALKEILNEEKNLLHHSFPLNEFLIFATSNGSISVFKYLVSTYSYGPVPRIDIKEEDNIFFRLAWRRGHLDIIEDLILNHNITHQNPELQKIIEEEKILEKTQILNWVKIKNEQLALKELTPMRKEAVLEDISESKINKI